MSNTTRKIKSKKNSVCSRLTKDQCRFPCKKSFSGSEFMKCRNIFSKKKRYLDDETKQVVYDGIKQGRKSEKKANRLRSRALESRKKEEKAKTIAVDLEEKAKVQDQKTTGFLESVSASLFGKKEPETEPTEKPAVSEVPAITTEIPTTTTTEVVTEAPATTTEGVTEVPATTEVPGITTEEEPVPDIEIK